MLLDFGVEGFAILHCFQEWLGVSVHSVYSAQLQIGGGGVEEKENPRQLPSLPLLQDRPMDSARYPQFAERKGMLYLEIFLWA